MPKLTRKRKAAYALALAFFVLCLVMVALPLWFPWILRPVTNQFGIRYGGYERRGYGAFALTDAAFSQTNFSVTAGRIELSLPTTFAWRLLRVDPSKPYLRVSDWKLNLATSKQEKGESTSTHRVLDQLHPIVSQVNHWLPRATFDRGLLQFGEKELSIPQLTWADGKLTGRVAMENSLPETRFSASLLPSPIRVSLETPEWKLQSQVTAKQSSDSTELDGTVFWQSNRLDVAARFGKEDLLPRIASLQSKSFRIPADELKLEGYQDLTGSLDARWQTNRFTVDVAATAHPVQTADTFLSPVEVEIRASGDTNAVRIETANVFSPWLKAQLSRNVDLSYQGKILSTNVTLSVAGDLSQQTWIPARGQLHGEAFLRPGKDRYPDTTFELSGVGVEIGKLRTERIQLQGEFEWPWLDIQSAQIEFKEGGTGHAQMRFNAVSRVVTDGHASFDGRMGGEFLPPGISYDALTLAAEISGPLTNLSHTAHAELLQVRLPQMNPLRVVADWQGTDFALEQFQSTFSTTNAALSISGAMESRTNQLIAHVNTFVLTTNGQAHLTLEKPAAASWTKDGTNHVFHAGTFRLSGGKTTLSVAGDVQWPNQGSVLLKAQDLEPRSFQDFVETILPDAILENLDLSAGWTNGPVQFAVDGGGSYRVEKGLRFSGVVRATGDEEGIAIEQATVGDGSNSILTGKGFLPVFLNPSDHGSLVHTLPKGRIDFHAATQPNPEFWELISKWTKTSFQDPAGSVAIAGSLDNPSGTVLFQAREVALNLGTTNGAIPRLQNLVADFDLVRDHIALRRFELLIEGQPVTATGELPLPRNLETNWSGILDWRKANVHLKMVNAKIAPFERLFPEFLSPRGTIDLDLHAASGKLEGELRVVGAALRPIPSVGPIHDIQAQVRLLGDQIKIEAFKGSLGGQPVSLTGQIHLPEKAAKTLPPFDFKLRGTNIPLARQPELILRSDVDLDISNKAGETPRISGTLNLRDSFYLSDVKDLIPGKVAKAKHRPPYFTVEKEPFDRWRLDVAVRGKDFFKVRSPLFRGEVSAALKIEGTLKEPMATGDARISSGIIQFPFANLRVDQGFVSLTSENPYRPQLSVTASARTFGYDVKMVLSGPADSPTVEFSSNPGLTSEQILLMITAGELPRDELTFSNQQKAGRLAFFLGKSLFSRFESTEENKLEIRSGDDISEQGRQTYYLEYKLTKDWSLVGEYDRFGAVNAGVKWIFFSK